MNEDRVQDEELPIPTQNNELFTKDTEMKNRDINHKDMEDTKKKLNFRTGIGEKDLQRKKELQAIGMLLTN